MPTTPMRNLLYRMALPFAAPSPRGQMEHEISGHPLADLPGYAQLLKKHHVLGASLLLFDGTHTAQVYTSTAKPTHSADDNTLFRVASITKMATALVTLRCIDDGLFALDTPVATLLPDGPNLDALNGVTVRHLLCHTSGLKDTPAFDKALRNGLPFHNVLGQPDVRFTAPGTQMAYCNLGFGLLGCLLENVTGLSIEHLFQEKLFRPLGMRATMDASTLDESSIMPISRVLPYRAGQDVTITAFGRHSIAEADPLRHFGHTAGAMYTDAQSLTRLLQLIASKGTLEGRQLISVPLMTEMTSLQASTATRTYGLGLVLLDRPAISPHRLLGHQGFAYGCVDGAFIEEGTGRMIVFLNGGASEARNGRLGLVNRDVLTWALREEMPSWT